MQKNKTEPIKLNSRNHLKGMIFAALFAAFTAAIAPPLLPLGFTPVPITLQTIGVLLAGAVLGPYYGALSMILYVLVGALGLPIFAGGGSGLGALFGYTGGYLFSYPLAAFAVGFLTHSKKLSLLKYASTIVLSFFAVVVYLDIFFKLGIMKICSIKTKACITAVSQMTEFQYVLAAISLIIIAILIIAGYYLIKNKLASFNTILSMFAGSIIIYIGGSLQGKLITGLSWTAIFTGWVLPFLIGDAIKLLLAAYISSAVHIEKYFGK